MIAVSVWVLQILRIRRVFIETVCHHVFHNACLTPWLALHNSCPLCRREIVHIAANPHPAAAPVDDHADQPDDPEDWVSPYHSRWMDEGTPEFFDRVGHPGETAARLRANELGNHPERPVEG